MSRLTRDGTTKPVSRNQILRRERGQGKVNFLYSVDSSRSGNLTRLIYTLLYVMTTYMPPPETDGWFNEYFPPKYLPVTFQDKNLVSYKRIALIL